MENCQIMAKIHFRVDGNVHVQKDPIHTFFLPDIGQFTSFLAPDHVKYIFSYIWPTCVSHSGAHDTETIRDPCYELISHPRPHCTQVVHF